MLLKQKNAKLSIHKANAYFKTKENNMTFIYIIKKIIGNWINILSNTHMMADLVVRETQSIHLSKLINNSVKKNSCL